MQTQTTHQENKPLRRSPSEHSLSFSALDQRWRRRMNNLASVIEKSGQEISEFDYINIIDELKKYNLSFEEIMAVCQELKRMATGNTYRQIRARARNFNKRLQSCRYLVAHRLNEQGENDYEEVM